MWNLLEIKPKTDIIQCFKLSAITHKLIPPQLQFCFTIKDVTVVTFLGILLANICWSIQVVWLYNVCGPY